MQKASRRVATLAAKLLYNVIETQQQYHIVNSFLIIGTSDQQPGLQCELSEQYMVATKAVSIL